MIRSKLFEGRFLIERAIEIDRPSLSNRSYARHTPAESGTAIASPGLKE
jgi:hypothetical protein